MNMSKGMPESSIAEWANLYEQANPQERSEAVEWMIRKIEDRQEEIFYLCQSNPKHLENLPAERLREVANTVQGCAHAYIFVALSQSGDKDIIPVWDAYQGLVTFGTAKDAPTMSELREAIDDIKAVFGYEGRMKNDSPITPAPGHDSRPLTALNHAQDQTSVGVVSASMVATDSAPGAGLRRLSGHADRKKKTVKNSGRASMKRKGQTA